MPPHLHSFAGAPENSGQDRITIHEDKDGDGFFETDQTFLEGLNMCTSFAFDPEGLWVMHPPYLLFYPDRNQDDRPDGPPEVHLSGFAWKTPTPLPTVLSGALMGGFTEPLGAR